MKQYTYTISWSQPYGQSIDVNKVQKIEQKEILEIADKYLLILELRSLNNEFMQMKFKDLNDKYKSQLNLIESENKKGLRVFFK
jgi:hypothetical protein